VRILALPLPHAHRAPPHRNIKADVGVFAAVSDQEVVMLYTLAVILLIAWLLGVVGTYTIGAFVHLLLVVALVLFVVGLLSGRQTVV
jgi:uncharacterized membrane protein (DUF485 family)